MYTNYKILLALVVSLLAGCATRGYTTAYSDLDKEDSTDATGLSINRTAKAEMDLYQAHVQANNARLYALLKQRAKGGVAGEYLIGQSDLLAVSVVGVDELNLQARVSQSGEVALPLVGQVNLLGLTERQAKDKLRNLLSQHLRRPEVVLSIVEYGGHAVAVLGAVQSPGKIPIKKGVSTLVEVIGEAGGVSADAGNFVTLTPSDTLSAESLGIELPLGVVLGLNGAPPLDIPLRGGDAVVVQPAGQVLVEGEVENRGAYSLSDNMTLVGALAAAGGVTYGAKYDEVEVVRRLGEQQVVSLVYDLEQIQSGVVDNPLLKNGDIVRVPSDNGKRMSQDFFQGLRRFIGIGGFIPL